MNNLTNSPLIIPVLGDLGTRVLLSYFLTLCSMLLWLLLWLVAGCLILVILRWRRSAAQAVDEDERRLWVHRFVALVVVLIAWVVWLSVKLLEPLPHPNWSLPFVSISVPAQVAFRAYYLLGIAWFIQLHFSLRRAGRAVLDLGHKRVFLMVTPTREDRTWKKTLREILYTVFWLSTMWWFGMLLNISIKKACENGLWLHGSLVSWKRMRSWEWGEGYDVIIRVRPMWWSFFTVVKVPVPDEDREPLGALLREHAPKGR